MNLLEAAIEDRRTRLSNLNAEREALTSEIERLEQAQELCSDILNGSPMKPPPRVEKKPVRTERAAAPAPKVVDKNSFKCGHPRTKENSYDSGYVSTKTGKKSQACRLCVLAAQKRSRDRKAAKAEPDPVRIAPLKPITVVAAGGLVLSAEERVAMLARADRSKLAKVREPARYTAFRRENIAPVAAELALDPAIPVPPAAVPVNRGTCECTDFETGKRCTLPFHFNKPPHSASGRAFYTALLPHEQPRRELDALAEGGR